MVYNNDINVAILFYLSEKYFWVAVLCSNISNYKFYKARLLHQLYLLLHDMNMFIPLFLYICQLHTQFFKTFITYLKKNHLKKMVAMSPTMNSRMLGWCFML